MTESEFNDYDQALVDIQCEIQLCGSQVEFDRFKDAYKHGKWASYACLSSLKDHAMMKEEVDSYINCWASKIEPRNQKGFRKIPIYIGGEARRNQDRITDQMDHFYQVFAEYFNCPENDEVEDTWAIPYMKVNPDRLYEWFERIHPFIDGNGRTGHLVWAFAMTRLNGVWPRTLPPNVFDDPRLRNHIHVHGEHLVKWDIRSDVWDFDTESWL